MEFIRRAYHVSYAPNTRETVRRQVLHQLVLANVADYNLFAPELPTNSPKAHYAISEAALAAIREFGGRDWLRAVQRFASAEVRLAEVFERKRKTTSIPVRFPGGAALEL